MSSSDSPADVLSGEINYYANDSWSDSEPVSTPITAKAIRTLNLAVSNFQSTNSRFERGISLYRRKKSIARTAFKDIGREFGYQRRELKQLEQHLENIERMGDLCNAAIQFDRRFYSYAWVLYQGHKKHRGYNSQRRSIHLSASSDEHRTVTLWLSLSSHKELGQDELAIKAFETEGLITKLGKKLGLNEDRVKTVRRSARRMRTLKERIAYVRDQLPAMSEPLVVAEIYRRHQYGD